MDGTAYLAGAAAAFVAGAMNSVAGGGTLVSFPALLLAGLDAKAANVTSTVALWPGSLGGFWGHRAHLAGTKAFALRLVPPSLLGGLAGALLLLATPEQVFRSLVPWLILGATLVFAFREPIGRLAGISRPGGAESHSRTAPPPGWWVGATAFQFLVGVYGGYFGAGIGIMMLAALGLLGLTDIHQMNGLKNALALAINGVAVICFAFSGQVVWGVAALMAVTSIFGGLAGAAVAQRLGRRVTNGVVVAIGGLVALWFFYKP
jgi:uncharacterized membrane protein YfcA